MTFKTCITIAAYGFSLCIGSQAAMANDPEPLNADPAMVAALVELDDGVAMPAGGAVFTMTAIQENTNLATNETYALVASESGTMLVLSEADQARLAAQQRLILNWMEDGIEIDGTVSFAINPCLTGAEIEGTPRVSISLRADAETGFQSMVEEMRLRELLGHPLNELGRCDAAG